MSFKDLERLAHCFRLRPSTSRRELLSSLAMFASDGDQAFVEKTVAAPARSEMSDLSAFIEDFRRVVRRCHILVRLRNAQGVPSLCLFPCVLGPFCVC